MHKVCALLCEPVSLFELGCVVEVFALKRGDETDECYDFSAVSLRETGANIASTVLRLDGLTGRKELERADTVIVPCFPLSARAIPEELEALRMAHARGARVVSICSGSFLLAEAGLLDGREATTHWKYSAEFARRFPRVKVQPDVLYVSQDGIVTAAGSAAGLDMMLSLVREDYGSGICNRIARQLNVPPHREGGQAQFIPRPVPKTSDTRINGLIAWIRENCKESIRIDDLASRVGMSSRSFYRHFREVTGHSPYEWLIRERIGAAMELLENSGLHLEQVAYNVGFASADALRNHFVRVAGIPPSRFREMYGRRENADVAASLAGSLSRAA